ncbi:MAG: SDR family oxidoreductase [Chloroflexota bacterium]
MQFTALVTGGNRGIGKEVCRQMAASGHRVVLTARSVDSAQKAAQEIGNGVIPARLDVSDVASILELYEKFITESIPLDTLINNAGINYDTWQRVSTADMKTVEETLDTNLLGPWRMIQTCLPLLRQSAHPRIVNVSSGAGEWNSLTGGTPAYSMSKLGLNGLTRMMAAELQGDGILVNAVCPGWVATDMGCSGGRPVADGASGIVWAATLPDDGPTGGFFRDGKPITW